MAKLPTDQPLITTGEALHINEYGLKQACGYLDKGDPLAALNFAAGCAQDAATLTNVAVIQARQDGASWREIGLELGMSRQAAQQRFADLPDAI